MKEKVLNFLIRANKDIRLKHSEVRILVCLISYNTFKKIFPSRETISRDTGIKSLTDISKQINRLKEFGYIEILRRKQQSNLYKLIFIKLEIEMNHLDDPVKEITISKFKEFSLNEAFFNTIMKINTGASEIYQKCFMILYCIGLLEKRKDEINNFQAYLLTTYKNLSYSEYHKNVFESNHLICNSIKPEFEIITKPEINY